MNIVINAKDGVWLPLEEYHKLLAEAKNNAPEGWKLVPIEPTVEMVDLGGQQLFLSLDGQMRRVYRAMLAASPNHEAE